MHIIEAFGKAFAANRYISVVFLVLPVIGLLERYGLQERARILIGKLRGATAGRLLLAYFLIRQSAAALGIPLGGQAQVVRPLLAPMVEGAAEAQVGELSPKQRFWLRAPAAAAENIGVFFGEDIFIAIGSVLLIKGFLEANGIIAERFALSVWAIPTAILAALIHGTRLLLIDRRLRRSTPPPDALRASTSPRGEVKKMITLEAVYVLTGVMGLGFAVLSARDKSNPKRFGNAAFWGLLALSFALGSWMSDLENGVLVIALIVVGGFGLMHKGAAAASTPQARTASAVRHGNALFLPALTVPLVALIGTLSLKNSGLVDPKQATLIFLSLGVLLALGACYVWLRPPLLAPIQEGRRLADTIGWAVVLPQMLASLGAVFAVSGVGDQVGHLATQYLPLGTPVAAVIAYCLGMALFTLVMGNAFAAFPVMTAAIGLPLIVHKFHGDPVIMSAIGMLAGFCGTLLTPMAANFNIVPAALLELPDRNGVIRIQAPTALLLLIANTGLMAALVYRF